MSAANSPPRLARARRALGTPWVRTIVVLTAAQVLSELAFSFALPFTPHYIQRLGVDDVTEAGLWAGLMAGVFAVAMGGMSPAIQALLIHVTPARRRGAAFGLLTTANAVGNGAGPVAGSVVAAGFGVPAVFVATMPVLGIAAWILARPRLRCGRADEV